MPAEQTAVEWITVAEAAKIAPGGPMTGANVRQLLYDRKIKGEKVNGTWKVDKASFLAYQPGPTSARGRRGGHRSQI